MYENRKFVQTVVFDITQFFDIEGTFRYQYFEISVCEISEVDFLTSQLSLLSVSSFLVKFSFVLMPK